jgi:hypothetical protein
MIFRTHFLIIVATLTFNGFLSAKDLENGNFFAGKSGWQGNGTVVNVKADGTVSPTKEPDTIPAVQINLTKGQFKDISQRFTTGPGTGGLDVEVVYKVSPDFKLNEKANSITKDITWPPESIWYWSALVYPKVGLSVRLDKPDGHSYYLAKVIPGDWQTAKFRWENVGEKKDVTLSVLAGPGDGTLWIKSVKISK